VLVGLLVVVLFFLIELLNIFWQLFLSLAVHMPLQPTDSYFSTLSTFTLPRSYLPTASVRLWVRRHYFVVGFFKRLIGGCQL